MRQKSLSLLLFVSLLFMYHRGFAVDVVFRFDDYRIVSDSLQFEVIKTFERNRIPISIGVIPFDETGQLVCSDTLGIDYCIDLQNRGLLEVCLHGYSHSRLTIGGEFGGLPRKQQELRLIKAKKSLEQLFRSPIVTFIPPWNNYDKETLSILDSLGFRVISSSMTDGQDFSNINLFYFPSTLGTDNAFDSFSQSLSKNHQRDGIIILMFHHYDFDHFSISDLDHLLKHINEMKDVTCLRFCDLVNRGIVSDEKRMRANLETNLLSKVLGVGTICQETKDAQLIRLANFTMYLLVLVIMMIFVFVINRSRLLVLKTILLFVALLLSVVLYFCVWEHLWTPLKSLMIGIVPPISLAALMLLFRKKGIHIPRQVPPDGGLGNGE